ncbi:MAG: DUF1385 domain-containing protein, partial [Armatimonadetes bacterium]|nr:DUF1385 domain-containing protein [Armatimonadota bacterium]
MQSPDADSLIPSYWPTPAPRISGTAMPTGVHLSDGWSRTSSNFELFLTGLAIMGLAAIAAVLSYIVVWVLDGFTSAPLTALMLGAVTGPVSPDLAYWQAAVNLIMFGSFLAVLRLSPLSGYHAAEHMTVAAIEKFGRLDPDLVAQMPRAHPRCGTTLLAGFLPALLVGFPLWDAQPVAAAVIVVAGWLVREKVGYVLQQYLTTKKPSRRQLEAGLRAGQRVLSKAGRHPPTSPAFRVWQRGFIQM